LRVAIHAQREKVFGGFRSIHRVEIQSIRAVATGSIARLIFLQPMAPGIKEIM